MAKLLLTGQTGSPALNSYQWMDCWMLDSPNKHVEMSTSRAVSQPMNGSLVVVSSY